MQFFFFFYLSWLVPTIRHETTWLGPVLVQISQVLSFVKWRWCFRACGMALSCHLTCFVLASISSWNQTGVLHWKWYPLSVTVLTISNNHEHRDYCTVSRVHRTSDTWGSDFCRSRRHALASGSCAEWLRFYKLLHRTVCNSICRAVHSHCWHRGEVCIALSACRSVQICLLPSRLQWRSAADPPSRGPREVLGRCPRHWL